MWIHEPASEPQKRTAVKYGLEFPSDITKGDLYLLINTVAPRKEDPPTPKQLALAEKLGIEIDKETVTKNYLGALLAYVRQERRKAILKQNPALKVRSVILYEGCNYKITELSVVGRPDHVRLRPVEGGPSRLVLLKDIADAPSVKK